MYQAANAAIAEVTIARALDDALASSHKAAPELLQAFAAAVKHEQQ